MAIGSTFSGARPRLPTTRARFEAPPTPYDAGTARAPRGPLDPPSPGGIGSGNAPTAENPEDRFRSGIIGLGRGILGPPKTESLYRPPATTSEAQPRGGGLNPVVPGKFNPPPTPPVRAPGGEVPQHYSAPSQGSTVAWSQGGVQRTRQPEDMRAQYGQGAWNQGGQNFNARQPPSAWQTAVATGGRAFEATPMLQPYIGQVQMRPDFMPPAIQETQTLGMTQGGGGGGGGAQPQGLTQGVSALTGEASSGLIAADKPGQSSGPPPNDNRGEAVDPQPMVRTLGDNSFVPGQQSEARVREDLRTRWALGAADIDRVIAMLRSGLYTVNMRTGDIYDVSELGDIDDGAEGSIRDVSRGVAEASWDEDLLDAWGRAKVSAEDAAKGSGGPPPPSGGDAAWAEIQQRLPWLFREPDVVDTSATEALIRDQRQQMAVALSQQARATMEAGARVGADPNVTQARVAELQQRSSAAQGMMESQVRLQAQIRQEQAKSQWYAQQYAAAMSAAQMEQDERMRAILQQYAIELQGKSVDAAKTMALFQAELNKRPWWEYALGILGAGVGAFTGGIAGAAGSAAGNAFGQWAFGPSAGATSALGLSGGGTPMGSAPPPGTVFGGQVMQTTPQPTWPYGTLS